MIYLSSNNHPHAKVKIKFDKTWEDVDCLIDTGFSSGISLPERYLSLIRSPSKWRQSFELADGSEVEFDLYKLVVRFGNQTKVVSAIFTKGKDALMGIEFLNGLRFLFDLKNYKISLE